MKTYDLQAPKKPANLSVNSDLLAKARKQNINLSAIFEIALANQLKLKQRELWLQENAEAIQAYNEFIEDENIFSNGIRNF